MAESKSELRYVKIGLTPDEYEVIAKLAELDGKPVATFYVNFMREAGTFTVLKQVLKASEKVLEIKGKFKADTQKKNGRCFCFYYLINTTKVSQPCGTRL